MSTAPKKGKGAKKGGKKDTKKDPKRASTKGKGGKNAAAGKKGKAAAKGAGTGKGKGKGAAKGKGKGKAAAKGKDTKTKTQTKATVEQKEDEKTQEAAAAVKSSGHKPTPSKAVNTGPDIILPETKEFVTKMPELTVTTLTDDDNVEELKEQFENLEKLLKQRKKDCLLRARILVAKDNEDTPPVCIDIEGMKHLLNNVGKKRGELDYQVMIRRQEILDKGNELLAYEEKQRKVQKTRDKTTPESIQSEINECKKALGEAEPILQASKDALMNITKSSLDEIRALPNPHKLLIKTVKACAIMVGESQDNLDSWGNIKKLLKTTFINNLLEFEARNITKEIRNTLESTEYLGKDGVDPKDQLTYENVIKANGVAGCLVQWLEAQLKYNEFIPKVEPELQRLADLEVDLLSIDGKIAKLDNALAELEKRIDTSKGELRDNGRAFDKARAEQLACQ